MFWPTGYWPLGYWPQGYWPGSGGSRAPDLNSLRLPPTLAQPLPRWMLPSLPYFGSGTILGRYLTEIEDSLIPYQWQEDRLSLDYYPRLGEPRQSWQVTTTILPIDITSISVSGNPVQITNSGYQFLQSIDPIALIDLLDPGSILLRNLDTRTVNISISGSFDPSPDSFNSAEDLYFSIDGIHYGKILAEDLTSIAIIPTTGSCVIKYSSNSLRNLLTYININGGPSGILHQVDLWGSWDELGLLEDLSRLPGEDNQNYSMRILSVRSSPGETTPRGVTRGVSRRLDRFGETYWNGVSTLSLSGSITDAWVCSIPTTGFYRFDNLNLYNNIWYGKHQLNYSTEAFVAGMVSTFQVSGGGIIPNIPVAGIVAASYRFSNWFLNYDSSGNVGGISPGVILPNIYKVGVAAEVSTYSAASTSFKKKRLLTPDGGATTYYKELATQTETQSHVSLGYTKWGQTTWFVEDTLIVDHLPAVYDE